MAKRTVKVSKRVGEYDARLADILASMDAHIKADAVAFKLLGEQLIEANKDLKVIVGARHFASGAWKALTIAAGAAVALVTLYLMYLGVK